MQQSLRMKKAQRKIRRMSLLALKLAEEIVVEVIFERSNLERL